MFGHLNGNTVNLVLFYFLIESRMTKNMAPNKKLADGITRNMFINSEVG